MSATQALMDIDLPYRHESKYFSWLESNIVLKWACRYWDLVWNETGSNTGIFER